MIIFYGFDFCFFYEFWCVLKYLCTPPHRTDKRDGYSWPWDSFWVCLSGILLIPVSLSGSSPRSCSKSLMTLKKNAVILKWVDFVFFNLRPSSSMNGSVHPSVFPSIWLSVCHTFLAATKQLYEWFSPSVYLSVTPFWLCSDHHIMNFQELLPVI